MTVWARGELDHAMMGKNFLELEIGTMKAEGGVGYKGDLRIFNVKYYFMLLFLKFKKKNVEINYFDTFQSIDVKIFN